MAHTPDPLHFCITCGQPVDPGSEEVAAEVLAALKGLHDATVDYIQINHLGDPHHNQVMKAARAAIAKAEGG